jgi:hypothetical protein
LGAGRRRIADQRVHGLADTGAGAVQQHPLVLRADGEQFTNFLGFPSLHIAEQNNRALAGRQFLDRILHMLPELPPADDPFRADLVPEPRRLDPVAVRLESPRLHCTLAGLAAIEDGRQRHRAALAGDAGAGSVEHDGEQPGGQGGPPLEPADAGEHRQPGVLHHLLGLGAAANDGRRDTDQRAMEAADQDAVGALLAVAQAFQKGGIIELGGTHGPGQSPGGAEREITAFSELA